jgi:hypothetical protein
MMQSAALPVLSSSCDRAWRGGGLESSYSSERTSVATD